MNERRTTKENLPVHETRVIHTFLQSRGILQRQDCVVRRGIRERSVDSIVVEEGHIRPRNTIDLDEERKRFVPHHIDDVRYEVILSNHWQLI